MSCAPSRLFATAAAFALSLLVPAAQAQAPYPAKPVRLLVGFAPGGGADYLARTMGQKLAERLQGQVVVENRAGANGSIAAEHVARSPGDGYTLFLSAAGLTVNPSLVAKIGYDPVRDFTPVSMVAWLPNVLVVHPSLPVTTVRDFIRLAKSRPGEMAHGSSGTGSPGHLAGEVFKLMAKVSFTHVPYRSSGQAVIDLIGGHVQVAFPTILACMPQVRAGKLRAVAVTGAKRSASLPELPTIAESGVPGYEVVGWYGILGPAGIPPDIVRRLGTEIAEALKTPELRDRLVRDGADPVGNTPEEFRAYLAGDVARWAKMVGALGLREGR